MMTNVLGLPPGLLVILVSFGVSLISTVIYKYMADQNLIKTLRADIKAYQQQMKEQKNNPEKVLEIQGRIMPLNSKLMMQTMKPTLVTLIPFLLVFQWLSKTLDGIVIVPTSFHVPLSHLPVGMGWLGTYFLCSLVFTTVVRKLLKVV